ncbi:hypothetical protein [Methylobacterium nigriterrae]|uniref:hypothetical protein n=1 Tax=Methylobacterium nigriterrae TaxID=3127512 RepID=UPI0030132F8D
MTADEYRAALKRLGLTHVAAAAFLGVEEITSRRWATAKTRVPGSVSTLLRLIIALKLTPDKVREWLSA